ncbi:MAG TPA: PQQ-dependent sugar dehydrogenase [Noviherbaspirillum sp.]|nr:PQQ-dependent sugar dehydrogenase [Noviherbaspirillum sp.]
MYNALPTPLCEAPHARRLAGMAARRLAALVLAIFAGGTAFAATVPSGFVDSRIHSGFESPTALDTLPDGRVLVLQQDGVVHIVKDDALLPEPFYTVPFADPYVETGCMGATHDPAFLTNGHVYFYCTIRQGEQRFNRVVRVTAQGDAAAPGSEQVILDLPPIPPDPVDGSRVAFHVGGAMRFGADGKLYVAVGGHENTHVTPAGDSFSQRLDHPFGKLLRLNHDGSFPEDNPFAGVEGAYPGTYSLGLRNPYTMDIEEETGRIFVNDVGAGSFEEIIDAQPGANYGWPYYEGKVGDARFSDALHIYGHEPDDEGNRRCAVTGGAFYDPTIQQFPSEYLNLYLFADYCSGAIYRIDPQAPDADRIFASGLAGPIGLAVAPDGSLYYLTRHTVGEAGQGDDRGLLGKITYTGSLAPRIARQPQDQLVYVGDAATFSVLAADAQEIQWQRNGVDIPGATAATYTLPQTGTADDGAQFQAVLRNAHGNTTSRPATLRMTTDRLPDVTILRPEEGDRYQPGMTITFSGAATDAEDGQLAPSALTWLANFHHDTHTHPFIPHRRGVDSGTVTVPDFEATTANTWIRFTLRAEDSAGQARSVSRDIFPRFQLSELAPSGVPENGLGPFERDTAYGGVPMALNGVPYPKGIGVLAPSSLSFQLEGICAGRLISDIGLDDSAGEQGSAVFQVYLDDALVFDSDVVRGGEPRQAINIDVTGTRELRLVVTDAGDGNARDRANWAGARLTCPTLPLATRIGN